MELRTVLGAAMGITLAVAGGTTAMAFGLMQSGDQGPSSPAVNAVEYVDQYGNPLAGPGFAATDPEIVFVQTDGSVVTSNTSDSNPAAASIDPSMTPAVAYFDEDEYEGEEEYEYEDEYEHEEEYEEEDHEEYDYEEQHDDD